MARTMLRTVWATPPDANENDPSARVRLTKGSTAPDWYSSRFVDEGEQEQVQDEGGPQHPSTGDTTPPAPWTPPDGSVKTVLEAVDGDPARAQLALDKERAEQNRSTLVDVLEQIVATAEDDEPEDDEDGTPAEG